MSSLVWWSVVGGLVAVVVSLLVSWRHTRRKLQLWDGPGTSATVERSLKESRLELMRQLQGRQGHNGSHGH